MSIGSTIKGLRREHDMTQEQLAEHLGITSNAVSQWERDLIAPDISQLPILSNLFEITIDELLENDEASKKEDIESFFRMIREELPNDAMEERLRLGKEYIAKYPRNYDIIHEMCYIIYYSEKKVRESNMPFLRSLCEKLISECTVQTYRESAIQIMCTLGDDNDWRKWSEMCAGAYKAYRGEIFEERLLEKGAYADCVMQKGVNKLELFCHLMASNCGNWNDPEKTLEWIDYRMELMRSFGEKGVIPTAWQSFYAQMLTYKADNLFRLSKNEEGYKSLDDACDIFKKWAEIPEGTALEVGKDWMFHGVKVLKNKYTYRLANGKEEYSNYMHMFTNNHDFLKAVMNMHQNWKGFDLVKNDERYRKILEAAELIAKK